MKKKFSKSKKKSIHTELRGIMHRLDVIEHELEKMKIDQKAAAKLLKVKPTTMKRLLKVVSKSK